MPVLNKCQYCGGEIKVFETTHGDEYAWECVKCGTCCPDAFETEQEAIAHANRRAK